MMIRVTNVPRFVRGVHEVRRTTGVFDLSFLYKLLHYSACTMQ